MLVTMASNKPNQVCAVTANFTDDAHKRVKTITLFNKPNSYIIVTTILY